MVGLELAFPARQVAVKLLLQLLNQACVFLMHRLV